MSTIILGASGYVGSRFALSELGQDAVLLSATPHPDLTTHVFDLGKTPEPPLQLLNLTPSRVIIATSLRGQDFAASQLFVANLKALLLKWGRSPNLLRVDYLSSQRVHTGDASLCVPENLPDVQPKGVDELYTLEMELFLQFFSQVWRPDVAVRVWRMPLATGGHYVKGHRQVAPLDLFYGMHYGQFTWPLLSAEEHAAGTSWVNVPDLVEKLKQVDKRPGLRTVNVASGHITYALLSVLFQQKLQRKATKYLTPLRLRFFVEDGAGLPQRNFEDCFNWAVLPVLKKFYQQ